MPVTGSSTAPTTAPVTPAVAPAGLDAVIGRLPYRLQMAGGWIDQPFVSSLDPDPPGSMVVVSLLPTSPARRFRPSFSRFTK